MDRGCAVASLFTQVPRGGVLGSQRPSWGLVRRRCPASVWRNPHKCGSKTTWRRAGVTNRRARPRVPVSCSVRQRGRGHRAAPHRSPGVPPPRGRLSAAGATPLHPSRRLRSRARTPLVLPVPRGRQAQEALPRQDQRPGGCFGLQADKAYGGVGRSPGLALHERTRSLSSRRLGPQKDDGAIRAQNRHQPKLSATGLVHKAESSGQQSMPERAITA
jgi:hypothetical protein